MNAARIVVVVIGIVLPYFARIPRGVPWVQQYTDVNASGFIFLGGFNAIAWGSIVALSFLYRRPASLLLPCLLGFAFLAWAHYSLDLAADAQAAIALVFIPMIAIGGALGYAMERYWKQDRGV